MQAWNAAEGARGKLRQPAVPIPPPVATGRVRRGCGVWKRAHLREHWRQQHEPAARLVPRPCVRRTAKPLRPRRGAQVQAAAPAALTSPQRRAGRLGCHLQRPARASGAPMRARSSPASCLGSGARLALPRPARGCRGKRVSERWRIVLRIGMQTPPSTLHRQERVQIPFKLTLGKELSTPHLRFDGTPLARLHQQAALATSVLLPCGSVGRAGEERARCVDSGSHAGRSRTRCSSSCRR